MLVVHVKNEVLRKKNACESLLEPCIQHCYLQPHPPCAFLWDFRDDTRRIKVTAEKRSTLLKCEVITLAASHCETSLWDGTTKQAHENEDNSRGMRCAAGDVKRAHAMQRSVTIHFFDGPR